MEVQMTAIVNAVHALVTQPAPGTSYWWVITHPYASFFWFLESV